MRKGHVVLTVFIPSAKSARPMDSGSASNRPTPLFLPPEQYQCPSKHSSATYLQLTQAHELTEEGATLGKVAGTR